MLGLQFAPSRACSRASESRQGVPAAVACFKCLLPLVQRFASSSNSSKVCFHLFQIVQRFASSRGRACRRPSPVSNRCKRVTYTYIYIYI